MKLEMSQQILKQIPKCEISWKSVQWKPRCSMPMDRRTEWHADRHNGANSHFWQVCESA